MQGGKQTSTAAEVTPEASPKAVENGKDKEEQELATTRTKKPEVNE
jgi:hypothetical protein